MVVVVARLVTEGRTELMVAPVTHAEPTGGKGVPIPPSVKRHFLKQGNEPSWIVTREVNRFVWPGPDVRTAKGADAPLYGAIPARLFEQLRQEISTNARSGNAPIISRTK